jgi:hypothetical protein
MVSVRERKEESGILVDPAGAARTSPSGIAAPNRGQVFFVDPSTKKT